MLLNAIFVTAEHFEHNLIIKMIQYNMIQYEQTWNSTMQYIDYNTIQCDTMWHDTIWYDTI